MRVLRESLGRPWRPKEGSGVVPGGLASSMDCISYFDSPKIPPKRGQDAPRPSKTPPKRPKPPLDDDFGMILGRLWKIFGRLFGGLVTLILYLLGPGAEVAVGT